MYSTHTIKRAVATLTVGILLAIGLTATAQAGNARPRSMSVQEWNALVARSDALNRYYHLGKYSPQTRAANERRAQAINRYYRLGQFAIVRTSNGFIWKDAGVGAGATVGAILLAGGIAFAIRRRSTDRPSFPTAA